MAEEKFTIEEIKKYILSQDSLGDVMYNLNAQNIIKANIKEKELRNDVIEDDFKVDDKIGLIQSMENYLSDKIRDLFDFDTWDECNDDEIHFEYDGEKYSLNFEYGSCIESTYEHRIMELIPVINKFKK